MINIDDKTRRLSQATIVVGYKQENKAESIEFEIPDYLKEYGKKICFKTKDGKVFSKFFDNTTSNIFTFTRTETQKEVRNQKLYTYKNITNISLSDELASIDVTYKKDLETMFNNIIKQIPSGTSNTAET